MNIIPILALLQVILIQYSSLPKGYCLNHWDNMEVIPYIYIYILVGGLEHVLYFHILGIILPTDELIFFRGVETTNQI